MLFDIANCDIKRITSNERVNCVFDITICDIKYINYYTIRTYMLEVTDYDLQSD